MLHAHATGMLYSIVCTIIFASDILPVLALPSKFAQMITLLVCIWEFLLSWLRSSWILSPRRQMLGCDREVPLGRGHYSGRWNGFWDFVGYHDVMMV
jgi:hypothetical protein